MKRSVLIDLLKLVAAQLIVLHHLSAYGPMSKMLASVWPDFIENFYNHSRLAVQIFLVIGGYLAAQTIRLGTSAPKIIQRRYLRLMPSYALALALITIVVWWLRPHISGDWLVDQPGFSSVLAHTLMLHGVFDTPAMSVGVWYVAIDFQLFAVLALLAAHARSSKALSWLVATLAVASAWCFNRFTALDNWAIYFFGSYGLGVLAAWSKRSEFDRNLFWGVVWLAVAALWVDPRIRLGVALITAVFLPSAEHFQTLRLKWAQRLSDSSYAQFLTHFGILVLASALWGIWHLDSTIAALGMLALTWIASILFAQIFHRWGELPLQQWIKRLEARSSAAPAAGPQLSPVQHQPAHQSV